MAAADKTETLPTPEFDKPVKLLIVVAPYHNDITNDLLTDAKATLEDAGISFDTVDVPGALEIPTAIAIAQRCSNYDGYVALGCIIRDQTGHYKTVKNTCYQAISQMGLNGICIGNGILMVKNHKQALRSKSDIGAASANAALHLVALSRKWGRETKGIGFKPASGEFLMADSTDDGPKTA